MEIPFHQIGHDVDRILFESSGCKLDIQIDCIQQECQEKQQLSNLNVALLEWKPSIGIQ